MIFAADALLLPTAQLTEQEKSLAALLEIQIESHIRQHMAFDGCNDRTGFKTEETNGNVIAAVNQGLRRKGWWTNWGMIYGKPKDGQRPLTGWTLDLRPTDEAYREAGDRLLPSAEPSTLEPRDER